MRYARNKGFSLIEAMVAGALVAVGVTGALRGYGALSRAQAQLQERDRMQRLAVSKYDEILATGLTNSATSGDFQDYNETRYKWELAVETTSTAGLDTVQITVSPINANNRSQAQVSGLVYTPDTSTTGATG